MAEPAPTPAQPSRKLSNLTVIWGFTRRYPLHLLGATLALTVSSLATLSVSAMSQLIVDKGFSSQAAPGQITYYFQLMLGVVALLGLATAVRFYFVSWIGDGALADP